MVRTYGGHHGASSLGGVFTQPQIPPPGPKPIDYDALLNKKRTEENNYRHSADPFVIPGNGPQASGNDPFMTRINEPPSSMLYDDYGLGNELRDLSGVLSRLQQNLTDSDDSGMGSLKIESYPQSTLQSASQVRKSWSAPTPGPDSAGQPTQDWLQDYNYAATGNQLADPLQHLRQKNDAPSSGTTYNPSVYGSGGKRGGNDRESYLRELEIQIAEQKARKEKENQGNQDWWEKPKDPQFQVNPPMRPHPSQHSMMTADQLPDPKDARKRYENELRQQMELKKQRENEEKQKILEEELKLERRIQEQQERMRLEFEEEQAKKRAKEDAKNKRQEQLAKRQEEIQREVEQKKKLEAEKRMQERRAAAREAENQRPADNNSDISRGSSPALTRRSDSPPLPTLLKKGSSVGGSSDGTRSVSSASVGGLSSGTDDEQGEVLNQLNTMKKQLDKLEVSPRDQKKRRQSQVWEGLAEV